MNVDDLASEIYCRVVCELLNGRGKPWEIKPQDLSKLSVSAYLAADTFIEVLKTRGTPEVETAEKPKNSGQSQVVVAVS
jgi:hypothetical protein